MSDVSGAYAQRAKGPVVGDIDRGDSRGVGVQLAARMGQLQQAQEIRDAVGHGAAVQREGPGAGGGDVHALAAHGTRGAGGRLPHGDAIQAAFGSHDISQVQAYTGGAAAEASQGMGARAYATGDKVAFGESPDLHTAAHEAAHVVQQRAGVSLKGGVGEVGDPYERHADAVADRVVAGQSAEGLLDEMAGPAGGGGLQQRAVQQRAVQRDGEDLTAEKQRITRKVNGAGGWFDKTTDYAQSVARWKSRNWTKFISSCGGNYFIAWSAGQFQNALAAVASTALGLVFGSTTVLGAMVGSAVLPGVGTVVGAIVGFLASLIIGGIMTSLSNDAAMRAVDSSLRTAGTAIQERHDEFDSRYDTTLGHARSERDNIVGAVGAQTTQQQLTAWEAFIDGEIAAVASPIPADNYTLHESMLRDWVLQHSGDEEDENKETNYASFDQNRDEAFGVEANDNLRRKDLFIHQTRYELGRMGLDYMRVVDRLNTKFETWGSRSAGQIASSAGFHGDRFHFYRTPNPDQTLRKMSSDWDASGFFGIFRGGEVHPDAEAQIRRNDFALVLELDLTDADGAVYVDHYNWEFDFRTSLPRGYTARGSYSVSPD